MVGDLVINSEVKVYYDKLLIFFVVRYKATYVLCVVVVLAESYDTYPNSIQIAWVHNNFMYTLSRLYCGYIC